VRKISVVSGIIVFLILAMQLYAQNLHKEIRPTAQKLTDWNGTRTFLLEANGFVTTVRGHGKACYFYIQYMQDNTTPMGSPTLLWCESDTKMQSQSRRSNKRKIEERP
jgi:hypothetical protein